MIVLKLKNIKLSEGIINAVASFSYRFNFRFANCHAFHTSCGISRMANREGDPFRWGLLLAGSRCYFCFFVVC
ncbi:hypothetical protein EMIT0P100_200038 [Pseudomonas sp. IT-P100]